MNTLLGWTCCWATDLQPVVWQVSVTKPSSQIHRLRTVRDFRDDWFILQTEGKRPCSAPLPKSVTFVCIHVWRRGVQALRATCFLRGSLIVQVIFFLIKQLLPPFNLLSPILTLSLSHR